MRFLHPGWLWMLIAVLPLFVYGVREFRRRELELEKLVKREHWDRLIPDHLSGRRKLKWIYSLLAFGFIILALARPQWGMKEESLTSTGTDMVFVFDLSNSMYVEDVIPNRLKKGKHFMRSIVERLQGDRVGIVGFAGSAFLASPLTYDLNYVLEIADTLSPKSISNQGTNIGAALETAVRALERGAEESHAPGSGGSATTISSKAIVLITDGEDLEGEVDDAIKRLEETGVRLFVVGVGTEDGGPIPIRDENGVLVGFKREGRKENATSKLNPKMLEKIASEAKGKYWTASTGEDEVTAILQELGSLDRTESEERKYLVYQERFQIFLALAVFFLFLSVSISLRRKRLSSTLPVLLLVSSLGYSGLSFSAENLGTYLDNESGIDALNKGEIDEAQRKFSSAQARSPKDGEVGFNLGIAKMQKKDLEGAVREFEQAAGLATHQGRPDLSGKALYNQGVSQKEKGDFEAAVKTLSRSILEAQKAEDPELEKNARMQIQRTQEEKKKQDQKKKDEEQKKEEEQKQKDQQEQGQKKEEDKKKDGENKPDEKDGDKQDEKKENRKKNYNRGQGYQSEKLSKDDAERVMNELAEKEKQLQMKLKKPTGKAKDTTKDW